METTLTVTVDDKGQRLDVFVAASVGEFSRSAIQKAIKTGAITVNNAQQKPRYVVSEGDSIHIVLTQNTAEESVAAPLPTIPILYEDRHVVVINKPARLTVHPGQGQRSGTLSDWFTDRYPEAQAGDPERPGIVHRLDKDTSGVMILAKTAESFEYLKDQFKRQRPKKEYLALVFGVPGESKGRITRPMSRSKRNPLRRTIDEAGKPAITEWRLEKKFSHYALLRAFPLTGRTHQIRVHFHFLGFPIVGDTLYVFKRQRPPQGVHRQLLHAEKLKIELPSGKERAFLAPLPEDFQSVLDQLK